MSIHCKWRINCKFRPMSSRSPIWLFTIIMCGYRCKIRHKSNVTIPISEQIIFKIKAPIYQTANGTCAQIYCSYNLLFEVNLAPSVNKMLSNCDDIIRQHKAACLRVTSLLACKDLIWVGTSAGVILTISSVYKARGGSNHSYSGGLEQPFVVGECRCLVSGIFRCVYRMLRDMEISQCKHC